jgi:hypothetical protein
MGESSDSINEIINVREKRAVDVGHDVVVVAQSPLGEEALKKRDV